MWSVAGVRGGPGPRRGGGRATTQREVRVAVWPCRGCVASSGQQRRRHGVFRRRRIQCGRSKREEEALRQI
ncbi:hypothetical protein E2562_003985 [Oryza meyeriana var. granulata]|uniref:Uncharacterized protein n=1 Tax=Oryza meyeriana var. granulata TaxID=110450 RepID=A0A6G1BIT8_9ORYZ|nr:hypothetical protein E2562_003985 [Oryza meyeriana var. granulata]